MDLFNKQGKSALQIANETADQQLIDFFNPIERERSFRLKTLDIENHELKRKNEQLSDQYRDIQRKLSNLYKDYHQLEQQIKILSQEKRTVIAELEQAQSKVKDFTLQIDRFSIDQQTLQSEILQRRQDSENLYQEQQKSFLLERQNLMSREEIKNLNLDLFSKQKEILDLSLRLQEELKKNQDLDDRNNYQRQENTLLRSAISDPEPNLLLQCTTSHTLQTSFISHADDERISLSNERAKLQSSMLQREYEQSVLKNLKQTLSNLQLMTGLTVSAIQDCTTQI